MSLIQPNCRIQLSAEDIEFIVHVLEAKGGPSDLLRLLTDEEARDLILDNDSLLRAVLDRPSCLPISTQFYFYLLVRHVFRRAGIDERVVADYVAALLAEFSRTERTRRAHPDKDVPLEYFVDMLAALQNADDIAGFHLRAHIGNYSLFLSGVFPDRIRFRAERRGSPDIDYYEELGRSNYRVAKDHRLARKYNLADVFDILAERFRSTRRALNDLRDRLISLGEPDYAPALISLR